MFVYRAESILPLDGARLKTSVWRRIPDYAIPSRSKVNGAYVNSVLAKQDAIDSGYDDCIFLDASGHVCERSAANIFIVRNGALITPSTASDLLEGINRSTVLLVAERLGIPAHEREVDLTDSTSPTRSSPAGRRRTSRRSSRSTHASSTAGASAPSRPGSERGTWPS